MPARAPLPRRPALSKSSSRVAGKWVQLVGRPLASQESKAGRSANSRRSGGRLRGKETQAACQPGERASGRRATGWREGRRQGGPTVWRARKGATVEASSPGWEESGGDAIRTQCWPGVHAVTQAPSPPPGSLASGGPEWPPLSAVLCGQLQSGGRAPGDRVQIPSHTSSSRRQGPALHSQPRREHTTPAQPSHRSTGGARGGQRSGGRQEQRPEGRGLPGPGGPTCRCGIVSKPRPFPEGTREQGAAGGREPGATGAQHARCAPRAVCSSWPWRGHMILTGLGCGRSKGTKTRVERRRGDALSSGWPATLKDARERGPEGGHGRREEKGIP